MPEATRSKISEIERCATPPSAATRLQHIAAVADRAWLSPLQRPAGPLPRTDIDQITVQPALGATVTFM
jgi:hypothetical protein